ncbi:MAG: YfhO family protein [Sphingobacteriaceae bacterium]|nr:YfhO family protein [Sphingobacteriaceae bacterium]
MKNWFKNNGTHVVIFGIFLAICFAYFSPVLQRKAPAQGDVLQAKAMQKEIMDYRTLEGKGPLWTNQMFGGMPAYQIWVQYPFNGATYVVSAIKTILPDPVDIVLLYLLGAYFLFCVLKINPWLAAVGAIAFAFTSYNFIIIAAGHSNKALAIAFCAPIIASLLLTLRGKHLIGGTLLALFLALEIRANHIQMTYYLFIALFIYLIFIVFEAYKADKCKTFFKSFVYVLAAMFLALMVNASLLWTTYEYGKLSNRGKSNLTTIKVEEKNGLSKEYAYGWSQGVGESFTFLIPNLYGGATSIDDLVKPESNMYKALEPTTQENTPQAIAQLAQQLGMQQYWGEKPGTSGPYYFGAIVCFLFVLGLFIVRNKIKWWILGTTILFMLLSFGKNLPLVSDIFFNYFPFYNKFRAVESILAVIGLLVPILAMLAIKELEEKNLSKEVLLKKLTWSAAITAGFSLLVALIPTYLFSFTTSNHAEIIDALTQILQNNTTLANQIANALVQDRADMARADALRSAVFIVLAYAIVWAYLKEKLKLKLVFIFLGLAILIDMWQVDKRYMNNNNFSTKADLKNHFQPREVDGFIAADKDPNFRVFDLSINTFSDASTSQFHKTIGGYHAAKLKRFQELIDKQFTKSVNQDVLDMLNTKYIITQDRENGAFKMQRNSTACGNAWLVNTIQYVKDADQEMKAINSFDPKAEAIVDEQFKSLISDKDLGADPTAFIKMEKYHPDAIEYSYSAPRGVIAVFSEIYYDKGWNMYVDGKESPYFRANYLLRAAQLPSGNHKVEFKFEPISYYLGEKIALFGSAILFGLLFLLGYRAFKKQ